MTRGIATLCAAFGIGGIALHSAPALAADFDSSDWVKATIVGVRAQPALDDQLHDYPSARFKSVTAHYTVSDDGSHHYFLCGLVNDKGPSGGYQGWNAFIAYENGTVTVADADTWMFVPNLCAADAPNPSVVDRRNDYSLIVRHGMTLAKFAATIGKGTDRN